jgi:hypothetical protein
MQDVNLDVERALNDFKRNVDVCVVGSIGVEREKED